ncbi:hypothetical protein [Desulfovibrio aminophilus]|uniref:hypothetical protein n=1 Tax=Desulfovibrio aminophilus TaxID=81425 RepID=UPI003393D400
MTRRDILVRVLAERFDRTVGEVSEIVREAAAEAPLTGEFLAREISEDEAAELLAELPPDPALVLDWVRDLLFPLASPVHGKPKKDCASPSS